MEQQVSVCKSGADDAGILPAQPGACCIAWRTIRRPDYLLNTKCVLSCTAVTGFSQAPAGCTLSCSGHQNGQMPCMNFHANNGAMQMSCLCPQSKHYVGSIRVSSQAESRAPATLCVIAYRDRHRLGEFERVMGNSLLRKEIFHRLSESWPHARTGSWPTR